MQVKVVIPASGSGTRLGGNIPKQFQLLGGIPILNRTVSAFQRSSIVTEIAIAVPQGFLHIHQDMLDSGFDKVKYVIEGGDTRATSVYAALKCLTPGGIVLIHDGARPLVSMETIEAVTVAAEKHGAAIACTAVTDTLKEATPNGKIIATPERSRIWRAQTPQGFTYDLIKQAYEQGEHVFDTVTDDCMLVERMGIPVYVVPTVASNIKITTPEDLIIAEAFLKGNIVK